MDRGVRIPWVVGSIYNGYIEPLAYLMIRNEGVQFTIQGGGFQFSIRGFKTPYDTGTIWDNIR